MWLTPYLHLQIMTVQCPKHPWHPKIPPIWLNHVKLLLLVHTHSKWPFISHDVPICLEKSCMLFKTWLKSHFFWEDFPWLTYVQLIVLCFKYTPRYFTSAVSSIYGITVLLFRFRLIFFGFCHNHPPSCELLTAGGKKRKSIEEQRQELKQNYHQKPWNHASKKRNNWNI